MIHEYAVEPEFAASWGTLAEARYFREQFGLGTPRLISRFPKRWRQMVYDAYAGELFRYASMLLADFHDAEDVLQQVFLKFASRRRTKIRSLGDYLRTAVRNECYRLRRTGQRARERTERIDAPALLEVRSPACRVR